MGYSISEISELIGYDKDVIQAIEEDRNNVVIVLDVFKKLALILGIPFRVLLEKL